MILKEIRKKCERKKERKRNKGVLNGNRNRSGSKNHMMMKNEKQNEMPVFNHQFQEHSCAEKIVLLYAIEKGECRARYY